MQEKGNKYLKQVTYDVKTSAAFLNFIHVGVGMYFHRGKFPEAASNLYMQDSWVSTAFKICILSDSASKLVAKEPSRAPSVTLVTPDKIHRHEIFSIYTKTHSVRTERL